YIEAPLEFIWSRVHESFAAVDTVLSFEARLNSEFPPDQKYSFEARGITEMKVYSREYSNSYNNMLNNQVERRMRRAVLSVGSFWYTAWVNAGQPDLNKFINVKPDMSELEEMQKEIDAAPDPALKPREHDN
ncbi:MAG: S1/P1 Nuclease, partial [Crocinitomicaceae bacterium]|nr:S1/P1 Nuclease [Crocinitomicaceae bacterium]